MHYVTDITPQMSTHTQIEREREREPLVALVIVYLTM